MIFLVEVSEDLLDCFSSFAWAKAFGVQDEKHLLVYDCELCLRFLAS